MLINFISLINFVIFFNITSVLNYFLYLNYEMSVTTYNVNNYSSYNFLIVKVKFIFC